MILQSSSLYFPQGSQESAFWEKYQALCRAADHEKAVIADFHRTMSPADEPTTWSIPASSGIFDTRYVAERDALYARYHPSEIDESLDPEVRASLVEEWFQKHLALFMNPEYGFTHDGFVAALAKVIPDNLLRPGIAEMLRGFYAHGIPTIIVSAGLGNFIDIRFERENIPTDLISTESNTLTYDADGRVSGIARETPITAMNKGTIELSEKSRSFLVGKNMVLVLGDDIEDVSLAHHISSAKTLKIAYCSKGHEPAYYDNTGYDAVYLGQDAYWLGDMVGHEEKAEQPAGMFSLLGHFA